MATEFKEQEQTSLPDIVPPTGEDQRKIHAEINQILNQRFLITTAAITLFGAFLAIIIPKDLNAVEPKKLGAIFVGSFCLALSSHALVLVEQFSR